MGTQTFSPRSVASDASKVTKRTVTDKQIRGMARDIIARFDKTKHPGYQSHEYSAAERRTLLDAFAARAAGRTRKATSKATSKARTTARKVKSAAQTPPVAS